MYFKSQAFIDFTGCCALTCSIETCKAGFCFFCLSDCGTDAHSHVRECPRNPQRGNIFVKASEKNKVHRESRKAEIVKYLMSRCENRSLRSAVLHSIVRDLKDLDIIINTSEVGLAGYTPIADTAKYRDHILNEICTLRCPRCKTVKNNFCFILLVAYFSRYYFLGILRIRRLLCHRMLERIMQDSILLLLLCGLWS